jgi:hypothetical protein
MSGGGTAMAEGFAGCAGDPRAVRKSDLPQKTCATCGRPFTWRKKWAKVWDEVRYCSDRCRGARVRPREIGQED